MQEHRGAETGLEILTELVERTKAAAGLLNLIVEVRYVLVIPSQRVAVQRDMPLGWEMLSGDVWALYLDFVDIPCNFLFPQMTK